MFIVIISSILLFVAMMYYGEIVIHGNSVQEATNELGFNAALNYAVVNPLGCIGWVLLIAALMVILVALETHRQKMQVRFFQEGQNDMKGKK